MASIGAIFTGPESILRRRRFTENDRAEFSSNLSVQFILRIALQALKHGNVLLLAFFA
jgi:hypothetical protein